MRHRLLMFLPCAFAFAPHSAGAHPHIFAEARLDVMVSPDRASIEAFRHLWRFDEMFTSTVMVEFDKDGDRKLDDGELENVRTTIFKSMAKFNYFQLITAGGKDVPLSPPDEFAVTLDHNQLIVMFQSKPKEPLKAVGKIDVGIYDPTFYTAIDFTSDKDMSVSAMPNGCTTKVVRPDPDEAIAQNQQQLDEAFFNDPKNNDLGKLFATRLEFACPPAQG